MVKTSGRPTRARWGSEEDERDDQRPLVTVITLCYNTGPYVIEALESVRQQSYQRVQVIVVDDASTDDSVQRINDWVQASGFPLQLVLHESNSGIAAALNSALRLANGKYVTAICDDLWDPGRLQTVVTCFQSLPPSVGILFGDATLIDSNSRDINGLSSPARTVALLRIPDAAAMTPAPGFCAVISGAVMRTALFYRCFIPAPSTTVRRLVYETAGQYDETLAIDDLDFYFRASHTTSFAYCRQPLVKYRQHPLSITSGRSESYLASLARVLNHHAAAERVRPDAAVKCHLREEAYRVSVGLFRNGLWRLAIQRLREYYLPNLQFTTSCAKETVKLGLVAAKGCVRSLPADTGSPQGKRDR